MSVNYIFIISLLLFSSDIFCMKTHENQEFIELNNLSNRLSEVENRLSGVEKLLSLEGSVELHEAKKDGFLKKEYQKDITFEEMSSRYFQLLIGKKDPKGEFFFKLEAKKCFFDILDNEKKSIETSGLKIYMQEKLLKKIDMQKGFLNMLEENVEFVISKYEKKEEN